ncbi:MAG: hypothetical protein Q8O88_02650 [bacterium]|nr:hypothetical protein [bacterium]
MNDLSKYLLTALIIVNVSCVNRDSSHEKKDRYGNKTFFTNDFNNLFESIKDDFQNDSAARLYVQATFFLRDDQLDSAKKYMLESYKIESDNKMLLKDFGILYNHLGQLDSAKIFLEKSIEVDSTYSLALSSYGLTYYSQDSDLIAIEYYNKAIKYDSKNSSFYLNKALAYQQLGYIDSCCSYLKIAQKYYLNRNEEYLKELIKEYDCAKTN